MSEMISFEFENYIILTLLCLILTFSLFIIFFFKKQKNGFDLPPSPPSLPIIGYFLIFLNYVFLRIPFHKSFQKISLKYGPFLHLRFFKVRFVLVSSASVAYEIFKTQDINVSSRGPVAIDECLLFGSFGFFRIPYGDYWKFTKKQIMSKVLGPQALERSRSCRAVEINRFFRKLLDKSMKKESIKIREEAMIFVINSLGKLCMGSSFLDDDKKGAEKVSELSLEFGALSLKFFVAQAFNKVFENIGISLFKREIMDVSNRFDELLESLIVKHDEKKDYHQGGNLCLDDMLAAENEEFEITRYHIKAVLVELFFGAGDSSSTTIQYAMAEIINNPKILERLREEIDSVVGKTRLVQEADIPKLPYLQAIINETLRMHPVGPLLPRVFSQGCMIGRFYIHEGTVLLINAYAVMRDPQYWEDPNEFKPERFLASSQLGKEVERREQALKFLPFGAGRRGCSGTHVGYILVGAAIGIIVQCFNWKLERGGEKVNMKEASGLRFFSNLAHPLECTLIPLTQNTLPSSLHITN